MAELLNTEKESFDPLKLLPESNPQGAKVKTFELVLASFILVSTIGVILPGNAALEVA